MSRQTFQGDSYIMSSMRLHKGKRHMPRRAFYSWVIVAVNCLCTVVSGCAPSVRDDWHDYQRAIRPDYSLLEEVVQANSQATSQPNANLSQLRTVYRDKIVPRLTCIRQHLETIHPRTVRVLEVHDGFLRYMTNYGRAAELLLHSMDTNNPREADEASQHLLNLDSEMRLYKARSDILDEEYGRAP